MSASIMDEALHEFAQLPKQFAMRGPDGHIEQVAEPAWQLLADGFYGQGVEATLFLEGEIIVAHMVPNFQMEPLNAAAGNLMRNWLNSLPMQGTAIAIEDLSEAAAALSKVEKISDMTPQQIEEATYKLAISLKKKRDLAQQGLVIPSISGPTLETVRSAKKMAQPAAPLMNARMIDQTRGGMMGENVRRGPQQQRRGSSAAAIMNQPAPARGA